jgi:hypothetical protein
MLQGALVRSLFDPIKEVAAYTRALVGRLFGLVGLVGLVGGVGLVGDLR